MPLLSVPGHSRKIEMIAVTLEKALEPLNLEPGRTYRCRVRDLEIELRVLPQSGWPLPDPIHESDIMLDPWIDFPDLPGWVPVETEPGEFLPPDIPVIPRDADDES
jgi:hypothetical protein